MPELVRLGGVIVRVHSGEHNPPHIHAEYAGEQAVISIDGAVIEGSLPRQQLKDVQDWLRKNKKAVKKAWIKNNPTLVNREEEKK